MPRTRHSLLFWLPLYLVRISLLGILIYGPDMLMSGAATWGQLFTFFVVCSIAAGGLLTLCWNKGLEKA